MSHLSRKEADSQSMTSSVEINTSSGTNDLQRQFVLILISFSSLISTSFCAHRGKLLDGSQESLLPTPFWGGVKMEGEMI
jgi:hypothetical protein